MRKIACQGGVTVLKYASQVETILDKADDVLLLLFTEVIAEAFDCFCCLLMTSKRRQAEISFAGGSESAAGSAHDV